MDDAAVPLVVLGATGRVGRLLLRAFSSRIRPLPQTRGGDVPPGWFHWQPGMALPEAARGGVMLNLAGPTPSGAGAGYDDHVALGLAGYRAARAAGMIHVLTASSAAVYGPRGDGPLDEDGPARPTTPYGAAKLAMEAAVSAEAEGGPGVTFLRIGNVAGTDLLMRNALAATLSAPLRLETFADGRTPRRAYIGAETLARVIETLVSRAPELPRLLNIAAPGEAEMSDLLAALASAGLPVPHVPVPAPATALPAVPLATGRIEALHPFTPADSLARTMIDQWLRLRAAP